MLETEIQWRDPLDVFEATAGDRLAILFHAGEGGAGARWSMIAAEPAHIILARRDDPSPFSALAALSAARTTRGAARCGAPFAGGVAGYAGYEALRWREPTVDAPAAASRAPDFLFGAFNAVAAFDRESRRAYLLGSDTAAIDRLGRALSGDATPAPAPLRAELAPIDAVAYAAAVANVIARIAAGDLFQANIAHRLSVRLDGVATAYGAFRRASARSSGAFGAFIRAEDAEILSFSPERFFRIDADRTITAEPIKGTRPRGATKREDAALCAALLRDPKDRAENVMIADLTRNDLSAICSDGSMREEAICEAMTTPDVHHLVSRISAHLRDGVSAVDALYAMFPCGSVTGAPKVEAMRVIADLERVGRGPYCGAIGFIDDSGAADFSVAIRTAVAERDGDAIRLDYCVGAGVTMRSNPQAEYRETLDKARGFLEALGVNVRENA